MRYSRLSPADERASPADGYMSMRPWVRLCGHGDAWAWRSLVMGMGMSVMGRAGYGHGLAWGMGRPCGW